MEQTQNLDDFYKDARYGTLGFIIGGAFTYESLKNFEEYNTYQSERNTGSFHGIPDGYISLGISGALTLVSAIAICASLIGARRFRKSKLEQKVR